MTTYTAYDTIQRAYQELGLNSEKYWVWYFKDNIPSCEDTMRARQACFISWLLTESSVVCPNFPTTSIDNINPLSNRIIRNDEDILVGDIAITTDNNLGIVTTNAIKGDELKDRGLWIVTAPWYFTELVTEVFIASTDLISYCLRPYYRIFI